MLRNRVNLRARGFTGVLPYSPAVLFAAGEGGYWLDPADLSTMWQDSQGMDPVTGPGQPCGLILDKRIGARTQAFDDANVTFAAPTHAGRVSTGVYEYARDATTVGSVVFEGLTTGKTYLVRVQIAAYAGTVPGITGIRADFISALGAAVRTFTAAAGTCTFFYVADGTNFSIRSGAPGSGGTISNVSILDVPGNHFLQSTTSARPIFGVEPVGGRRNLIIRTEEFDNPVWVKTNTSVVANNAVAPDGTMTADTITSGAANSTILQNYIFAAATYRFSVWLRRVSGTGTVEGTLNNFSYTSFALTSQWQRFSLTHTTLEGNNGFQIRLGSSGDVIEAWGAQLELGSVTTNYQRVVTGFEVTEAGVPSVSYLAFDGTDDGMQSVATVNPGAVDKMQLFAGLRKLSDAAAAIVIEASATASGSNLGAFYLAAPEVTGAGGDYSYYTRGSTGPAPVSSGTFLAPDTAVITATADIVGDSRIVRRNGTQVGTSVVDLGTGNYLTYPHFIGRRNNASLPFNGRVYQTIVRYGANLAAADITAAETFVNSRTGAY